MTKKLIYPFVYNKESEGISIEFTGLKETIENF